MALQTGSLLGRYRIVAPLAKGAMGEIFVAEDEQLRRKVAVKVLPAGLAQDPARRARFEREARAIAALSHPNIVAIHDFGDEQGITFAVMELLEGSTLRAMLRQKLPTAQAIGYAAAMADALAAAHDKGIVHRDLKPENIVITREGRPKILDFGLARIDATEGVTDSASVSTVAGTLPGSILGTVGYMSPEQARGERADLRSDIFAFGAIFYEMLYAKPAFDGGSAAEILGAILRDDPVMHGHDRHRAGLRAIIQRCLQKDPADRFQSTRELMAALVIAGAPTTASRPWKQFTPASWLALAAIVVAITTTLLLWQQRHDTAVGPEPPVRIAVLPFDNLGKPEDEYFAGGLTAENHFAAHGRQQP